ncbi:MAG: DUF6062 family protein [Lachnospiraceae bacterium]|jgi:hypothetical protein|nr:DUF6062 family protein [Lachnospiraceae bacterium]
MKEKLYTIPLNDAVDAGSECPFCHIEREVEQGLLDFVLGAGSSYMESDVRDLTDRHGFCRRHFKQMYDYGNTLGNAWILKTHYMRLSDEMEKEFHKYMPGKKGKAAKVDGRINPLGLWAKKKEKSCYICKSFTETYERYLDTFFIMYKNDPAFQKKIAASKGFCLAHFGDLCEAAETKMSEKEKREFFPLLLGLMSSNFSRLADDIAWLVDKFDYRNHDADWKNSRDALQRGMQKLKGGYPADPPYKKD